MLTKKQIKIIMVLLDNEGHANWNIAKLLKTKPGSLSQVLDDLVEMGIIEKGSARLSERQHKKKGKYPEFPYYLKINIETIQLIIRKLLETNLKDTWFIFKIIGTSKYLRLLREKYSDVDFAIEHELDRSSIFKDKFYDAFRAGNMILEEAPVSTSYQMKSDPEKEIENWYNSEYVRHKFDVYHT